MVNYEDLNLVWRRSPYRFCKRNPNTSPWQYAARSPVLPSSRTFYYDREGDFFRHGNIEAHRDGSLRVLRFDEMINYWTQTDQYFIYICTDLRLTRCKHNIHAFRDQYGRYITSDFTIRKDGSLHNMKPLRMWVKDPRRAHRVQKWLDRLAHLYVIRDLVNARQLGFYWHTNIGSRVFEYDDKTVRTWGYQKRKVGSLTKCQKKALKVLRLKRIPKTLADSLMNS